MRTWLVLFLLPMILLGCNEPETGPVKIHFDRDMCERCRMIISDRGYAAQVRGGPGHKAYKFDDIGGAAIWLNEKPWANDPKTEIWVMDHSNGKDWIEARSAHFVPGLLSPMAYGFGAYKEPKENSMDFKSMLEKVLDSKITINCDIENPEHSMLNNKNNRSATL